MENSTHYLGIYDPYKSCNYTVFYDVDPLSSLSGTVNGHIPSKRKQTKAQDQKFFSNTSQQQDLFDPKVSVEIILWQDGCL